MAYLLHAHAAQVVGSLPELGAWDAAKAPALKWHEGHRWELGITLPRTNSFEFKVNAQSKMPRSVKKSLDLPQLIVAQDGNAQWEEGENRVVQADSGSDGGPSSDQTMVVKITCSFNNVEGMELALMLPRDEVAEAYEVSHTAWQMLETRQRKLQEALGGSVRDSIKTSDLVRFSSRLCPLCSSVNQLIGTTQAGGIE